MMMNLPYSFQGFSGSPYSEVKLDKKWLSNIPVAYSLIISRMVH